MERAHPRVRRAGCTGWVEILHAHASLYAHVLTHEVEAGCFRGPRFYFCYYHADQVNTTPPSRNCQPLHLSRMCSHAASLGKGNESGHSSLRGNTPTSPPSDLPPENERALPRRLVVGTPLPSTGSHSPSPSLSFSSADTSHPSDSRTPQGAAPVTSAPAPLYPGVPLIACKLKAPRGKGKNTTFRARCASPGREICWTYGPPQVSSAPSAAQAADTTSIPNHSVQVVSHGFENRASKDEDQALQPLPRPTIISTNPRAARSPRPKAPKASCASLQSLSEKNGPATAANDRNLRDAHPLELRSHSADPCADDEIECHGDNAPTIENLPQALPIQPDRNPLSEGTEQVRGRAPFSGVADAFDIATNETEQEEAARSPASGTSNPKEEALTSSAQECLPHTPKILTPEPTVVYASMTSAAASAGLPPNETLPLIFRAPSEQDTFDWQPHTGHHKSSCSNSRMTTRASLNNSGFAPSSTRGRFPEYIDVLLDDASSSKVPIWVRRLHCHSVTGRDVVQSKANAWSGGTPNSSNNPIFTPFSLHATEVAHLIPGFWSMHVSKLGSWRRWSGDARSLRTDPESDEKGAEGMDSTTPSSTTSPAPALSLSTRETDTGAESDQETERVRPRKRQKRRIDGWQQSTIARSVEPEPPSNPLARVRQRHGKNKALSRSRDKPTTAESTHNTNTQKPRAFELVHIPDIRFSTAPWSRVQDIVPVAEPIHAVDTESPDEGVRPDPDFGLHYRIQQTSLQGFFESKRQEVASKGTALVPTADPQLLKKYCIVPLPQLWLLHVITLTCFCAGQSAFLST